MEPIINPWWIYFAEKSESLGEWFDTIGILMVVIIVMWWLKQGLIDEEIEIKKSQKWMLVLGIVFTLVGSIFPSKETVLTMVTIEQITPNNIKYVGETVEDTVDYVVDKINGILNNEEENSEK